MSWLCIAVIIIWALIAMNGFRRGLVRTAISMVSFVVVMILVLAISPVINDVLVEKTTIREQVEERCAAALADRLQGEAEPGRNEQVGIIEELPLPQSLKDKLLENNNSVIYDLLSVNTFSKYLATYMAKAIVQVIAYLISFILAILLVRIITYILDIFANLPILGGINRVGGLMLGIIIGLLDLWIFFLIITVLGSTETGAYLLSEISGDKILSYLYDNNLLMQFLIS